EDTYTKNSWPMISSVLQETGIKNFEKHKNNYNPTGISLGVGDFIESAVQANFGKSLAPSNTQVINNAVAEIKQLDSDAEKQAKEQAKNDCKCQPKKPKYLIIAHSQGNFFAKEVASTILNTKPDIFERLSILAIASFTNYQGVIGGLRGGGRFEYMLRSKDFPFRYRDINIPLLTDVSNPGRPNIPDIDNKNGEVGEYQEPSKVLEQSTIKDAALAHGLEGYLGDQSFKEYEKYADSLKKSREEAVNKIKKITSYDSRNYQSEQCQADQQSPQPQQTVQKPSITVTITGPTVIEVNQKTTVEVKFVVPACIATSVTLFSPSLALPKLTKPIPAESACGGTISFAVGTIKDNGYGCEEYKNVFGASVSGEKRFNLSAKSPPVTVKHKPGFLDYASCYAWPLD
ncbi:MAG TPA: hypothetical protein V6D21_07715, partial [Candidatus Obscuribacterales bacterium]